MPNWKMLIAFLGICYGAAAGAQSFAEDAMREWYPQLRKPTGAPDPVVLAPVWIAVFTAMAFAAWIVWNASVPLSHRALVLFFIQLGLNVSWFGILFSLRKPLFALAEIVLLWLAIAGTVFLFWKISPVAGALMLPHLFWITYAAQQNFGIWWLNRDLEKVTAQRY